MIVSWCLVPQFRVRSYLRLKQQTLEQYQRLCSELVHQLPQAKTKVLIPFIVGLDAPFGKILSKALREVRQQYATLPVYSLHVHVVQTPTPGTPPALNKPSCANPFDSLGHSLPGAPLYTILLGQVNG